ncbi:MAG: hypothetical protein WA432_00240 [Candidatus Babeliaceae bacterium]
MKKTLIFILFFTLTSSLYSMQNIFSCNCDNQKDLDKFWKAVTFRASNKYQKSFFWDEEAYHKDILESLNAFRKRG